MCASKFQVFSSLKFSHSLLLLDQEMGLIYCYLEKDKTKKTKEGGWPVGTFFPFLLLFLLFKRFEIWQRGSPIIFMHETSPYITLHHQTINTLTIVGNMLFAPNLSRSCLIMSCHQCHVSFLVRFTLLIIYREVIVMASGHCVQSNVVSDFVLVRL